MMREDEEWDRRARILYRAMLAALRPDLHAHSGLTGRVNRALKEAGIDDATSGYELLEMWDWLDRKVAAEGGRVMREDERAKFLLLRDTFDALGTLENRIAEVAEFLEDSQELRDAAEVLQRVRAHYWPMYAPLLRRADEKDRGA